VTDSLRSHSRDQSPFGFAAQACARDAGRDTHLLVCPAALTSSYADTATPTLGLHVTAVLHEEWSEPRVEVALVSPPLIAYSHEHKAIPNCSGGALDTVPQGGNHEDPSRRFSPAGSG
jgi:hypothetical protein